MNMNWIYKSKYWKKHKDDQRSHCSDLESLIAFLECPRGAIYSFFCFLFCFVVYITALLQDPPRKIKNTQMGLNPKPCSATKFLNQEQIQIDLNTESPATTSLLLYVP